jgi:hypothetical protein
MHMSIPETARRELSQGECGPTMGSLPMDKDAKPMTDADIVVQTTTIEAAEMLIEARLLVRVYLMEDDAKLTSGAIRLKRRIARAIVEAGANGC